MTGLVSVAVPEVNHAAVKTTDLIQKLCIHNLDFHYGQTRALRNISLTLYANKVTAIIGRPVAENQRFSGF